MDANDFVILQRQIASIKKLIEDEHEILAKLNQDIANYFLGKIKGMDIALAIVEGWLLRLQSGERLPFDTNEAKGE